MEYSVEKVIRGFKKSRNVRVCEEYKEVYALKGVSSRGVIGNGTLGKLSFLSKNGYTIFLLEETKEVKQNFNRCLKMHLLSLSPSSF